MMDKFIPTFNKIKEGIWYTLSHACPICNSNTKVKFISLYPIISIEKCSKCLWRR
jgi:hypothetical protein